MQIAIELPNDFVAFQPANEIQRDIRISYALWLFKGARVTIGKAAELAGLDIYDFMSTCKENQIPVIDLDQQALIDELQDLAGR